MKHLAIIISICSLVFAIKLLSMQIEIAVLRWEGIELRKIQVERSRLLYEVCGSEGSFNGGNITCGEPETTEKVELL